MKTILIQLDTDPLPSSFDRVVAVDAGVDELFSYGGITPENVVPLVHGAMFTRGGDNLRKTAIFVGGSDVAAGEAVLKTVRKTFFGPVSVSVMMDSNGSNTTAVAAVLAVQEHVNLDGRECLVLGATGPVGQRAVQLLAGQGGHVRAASRNVERAQKTCDAVSQIVPGANLIPVSLADDAAKALEGVEVVIAAGAAGVELLAKEQIASMCDLRVAVDLNAVPPAGIAGIEVTDRNKERSGLICYGALGVGGVKMRIHKAAVQKLFESNDLVLDTDAIYGIGRELR